MTKGIHHITAIASDARDNLDFYSQILGLRLVKKTVNQDDVETYHLFYGDTLGHPGLDLTFFIFQPPMQGRRGTGLVTKISLAVPPNSLSFWEKRFKEKNVKHEKTITQFGFKRMVFYDHNDQKLELVEHKKNSTDDGVWTTKEITVVQAIRHFHSATLSVVALPMVERILTDVFEYNVLTKEKHTHLFHLKDSFRANYLEVSEEPSSAPGINTSGTVHHIAFRAHNVQEQMFLRDKVISLGLYPTEVIDRYYFKSVYFRTPSGILFEIATDGPGFTADEDEKNLGKKLALPPFLEKNRDFIEKNLTPIN